MPDSTRPAPEEQCPDAPVLARQVRQHLESLRAAGLEWIPDGSPVAPVQATPISSVSNPVVGGTLFADLRDAVPASADRRQALHVLAGEVSGCRRCGELAATRTQTVFGVGPVDADLCFIGEAPGADEDAQGEPFVGAAGQLLNRIITACGMNREEVYICNILRCRPPGNRLPLPNEATNCRPFLDQTLDLVRPRYICALGACAAQNLLGTTQSIGKLRGRFHSYRDIPVMCTYHPAYLLRSPDKKRDVWEDMKKLLERMGRPVPNR